MPLGSLDPDALTYGPSQGSGAIVHAPFLFYLQSHKQGEMHNRINFLHVWYWVLSLLNKVLSVVLCVDQIYY